MEVAITEKFWILQWIQHWLIEIGIGNGISDLITFGIACCILALLVWLFDFIGTKILLVVIHNAVKRTETMWDDFLVKRKFFNHVLQMVAAMVLLFSTRIIFKGYHDAVMIGLEMVIQISIVVLSIQIFSSFFDAANDIYNTKPQAKQKSIKGYIQTSKIIVYVVGGIFILAILFRKNPSDLLLGLGASAAIVTLVFKDTILGFVASIQISAQDMIRPGDWIEMPSKNADGVVTDINVNSVKVRNWNNTITMIPIYSLVSESFTNWRNMEESGGRRFKRPLLIDILSVEALSPEQIEKLCANPLVTPLASEMLRILALENTSSFSSNLGLFRAYTEAYLTHHPKVDETLPLIIKYLPPDENGIAIELYGFSREVDFVPYERVVADLFENIIVMAPLFGIRLYQRPMATVIPKTE